MSQMCPRCDLLNPDSARCCDCGFPFTDRPAGPSEAPVEQPRPRSLYEATTGHALAGREAHPGPPRRCDLCGGGGELQPFYLRTLSCRATYRGTVARWTNFPAQCCDRCFGRVARLQAAKLLLNLLAFGPILLAGFVLLLGNHNVSGPVIAVAFGAHALGLAGLIVVFLCRRSLVRSRHLAPLVEAIKALHGSVGGEGRIRVIPLASVSDGSSIIEMER